MANWPHGYRATAVERRESTPSAHERRFYEGHGSWAEGSPWRTSRTMRKTGDSGGQLQADGTVQASLWGTAHGKPQMCSNDPELRKEGT